MKKIINKILVLIFVGNFIFADVPKKSITVPNFNSFVEDLREFRTDNMAAGIANNGLLLDYHFNGQSGLKFKNVYSTFQKSLWFAGKINGSIVGVVGDYTQDMAPGAYGGDPLAADHKIYFVDLDMMSSPESYDDFQNWPADQGAPFIDVDGDGVYNPLPNGTDYPEFIGDKVAFFVANDGDSAYKLNMGSAPTNIEFQVLIYSFDQSISTDLANSLFFKILLINKGTSDINESYLGMWMDDDVGLAGNDLVGVSVPRDFAYTYSDTLDSTISDANIDQFVVGHDFLQGPKVPCDDPTDSVECPAQGAKMFGTYFSGEKNLKISSFSFYINGDATYTDPSDMTEAYNYMQGLRKDGSAYPTELAGDLYNQKFNFYGDPTQNHSTSNPVDGNYATPADRRSMLSIGPFTMAAGDSQEVVFNTMHVAFAEGGTVRENGISNLITANDSIQSYYDNDFSILADNNEELTLDISESVSNGVAPLAVTFNLVGSPSFSVYNWDFDGDGVTDSNSLNPTYVFNKAGTYDVSLTASYKYYENGRFFLKELTDSVSITVTDSSSGVVVIASDTLQVNEDETGSVALSITNDNNRNFDLQLDQQPVNGSAYFDETTGSSNTSIHTLYYTPNDNFNGSDSLSVFAKDGSYESASAMINITVLPVDDTPSTQNVSATVNEDDSVVIYLSASEVDGDDYEFEIKENPSNGSISAILSAGNLDSLIYTPDANWFGSDQFKFEAKDSSSRMNVGIATIQVVPVNDAPTTNALSVNTYEDVTTPIELDFTDIDSDQLTISYSTPSNGSISLNGSYLEYTPTENYFGQDSLTFSVNDGEFASNTSTISITIDAVNDASSDFSIEDIYIIDSNAGEEWVVSTNSLIATKENQEDSLQFNWNESFDIDGDKIQYRMIGFNDLEFLTMDDWITDLTLSWSIKDLVANTDTVNVAQGSWMIVASDGEFFVESNYGNPMELSINGSALIPDQYSLNQNYPNPFKNFTTISFDMPENQKVKIRIFDVRGRVIRTLINEDQSAGFKSILWDGKNEDGDEVSAGVYFYQMYAPSSANFKGISKTKRMVKFD